MKKCNLVLANNSDGLYGFRRELLESLSRNAKVVVAVPDNGYFSEIQELGCDIIEVQIDRRGINPVTDLKLLHRYYQILRQVSPDMVITYTIKPNIYGGLMCRLMKIPYAVNITGLGTAFQRKGMLRRFVTILYRLALKKVKIVFFENSANRDLFIEEKIIPAEECCLLSGAGVNLQHFSYKQYPKEEIPIHFLFIGRVMKEKGIEELFGAMQRLHEEGLNCRLDILGNYEEDYEEQIAEYERRGWLFYHGFQKDVRPFIQKAHCFVLPSYHEGMANTNLECAAMGRPIITSNIPGCKEAVIEGKSGLLCEPGKVDSLYRAMRCFLELSGKEREQMGREGRRHMEEAFDKKKVVQMTLEKVC